MREIRFRVDDKFYDKALEIESPHQVAKNAFINYIQERIVPTPKPEELLEWIIALRPRIIGYMHASFAKHELICKWICEKHNITPKQFYHILPLALTHKNIHDKDGKWRVSVAKGSSPRHDDIIIHGQRYKFIEVYGKPLEISV